MKVLQILATGLIAAAGGLLFHFLRTPLPWMLGPLAATIIDDAPAGRSSSGTWV